MCTTQWKRVEKSDEFPTDTYANGITVNQVYMRETFSFFTRSFMVTIVYFHIDNEQHRVNKVAQIAIQSEQRSQLANYFC